MKNNTKKLFLFVGDIAILYLSLYLTLKLRYFGSLEPGMFKLHLEPFTVLFFFWIVIFYIFNLYNLNLAVNNFRYYQTLMKILAITGLISVAFFYLVPQINIAPKRNLIIFILVFAIVFSLWRNIFNWLLKSRLPKNNIAIIGYNNLVEKLIDELNNKSHLGYNVRFIIDESEQKKNYNNVALYKNTNNLRDLIKKNKINTIVLVSSPHHSSELRSILFECLPLKINFISIQNFYEIITGKVPIESINKMWFLENLSEGNKKFFDSFKRVYDFLLASFIFLITLPFWLLIALIIKSESKGPVFFTQKRIGKNTKIFKLLKFRTMREEGNSRSMTTDNDPRITRFGSFMRKTRIDEIPQVLNIIKGDMSLVGPRPERPELAEELSKKIPFFNERVLVKPGVTGWDQISGEYHSPSIEDTLKKIQYDLFYIKNRSIYLDLSIVLKTVSTVISKGGR